MRHLLILTALVGCSGGKDTGPDASDVCSLDMTMPDDGARPALLAQLCNVPGSMGAAHWYKLSETLPEPMDVVQLELWDHAGAFAGTTVHAGTFTIGGADADPASCGVCLRAMGDKGLPTQKEYFATAGTVSVTALGGDMQPISATLSNITFVEADGTAKKLISDGCTASLAGLKVDGTVVKTGGGGGGGGGAGGAGSGGCKLTVGD